MSNEHSGELDHLIRMANQIAANLAHSAPEDQVAEAVASHLTRFWARPMKAKLLAHQQAGGAGLDPLTQEALVRMGKRQTTA